MSAKCQKRTSHHSFDHLVRTRLHRRHFDAERFVDREIDDRFKLGRLHDWQFSGVFAFENPTGISASQTGNEEAAVTATLYRLPIADSAYGKVDCLGGSRCPNFHLQRDPHARGKFASVRLNFPPTRSRLSGSLSGIPLLRSSANSLSKHWQISVGAVLTPQSYSGFRSAPCGTRSTTTMGVENQCLNQRSIE